LEGVLVRSSLRCCPMLRSRWVLSSRVAGRNYRTPRRLPSGRKDRARKQPWAARAIFAMTDGRARVRLRPSQFSCPSLLLGFSPCRTNTIVSTVSSLRAAFPVSRNNPKYVARATSVFLDRRAIPISLPIMRQVHSFSTNKNYSPWFR